MTTLISNQLLKYILPIEIVFGTIGNIFNILIFTRRTLRSSGCSFCFLCASVVNLFVIYPTFIVNLIKNNYSIDITTSSVIFCKVYTYITNALYILPQYFIILAIIDRYCLTSSNAACRKLSNLFNVRMAIILLVTFFLLAYIHILIYYGIYYGYCIPQPGYYTYFYIFFENITYSYLPPCLMFLFGILTLFNIKQTRLRIVPIVQRRHQRTDAQLLKMLLIQILAFFILVIPVTIVYIITTFFITEQPLSPTMNLILTIANLLFYFNYCASFYIYTLASHLYRQELMKILAPVVALVPFAK
jgi:hypothetical protein